MKFDWFLAKSLLFRTHHLWNATTELILLLIKIRKKESISSNLTPGIENGTEVSMPTKGCSIFSWKIPRRIMRYFCLPSIFIIYLLFNMYILSLIWNSLECFQAFSFSSSISFSFVRTSVSVFFFPHIFPKQADSFART